MKKKCIKELISNRMELCRNGSYEEAPTSAVAKLRLCESQNVSHFI